MKWTSCKAALCCGLAILINSPVGPTVGYAAAEETAVAGAQPGSKGDRRENRPQPNRREGSQPSSNRTAQPSPSRNTPGSSRRGAIHVPPTARPSQATSRDRQQPSVNRTPTLSRPNIDRRPSETRRPDNVRPDVNRPDVTRRPGVNSRPSVNVRPNSGNRIENRPGVTSSRDRITGTLRPGEQGLRGDFRDQNRDRNREYYRDYYRGDDRGRDWSRNSRNQFSRTANRPFYGNTFRYGNRQFNVGYNSYRPAYYRHSGYHGYWNNNRFYGDPFGYGYGYGYGFGNYGYRPFGWGLGGWGLGSLLYNSGYLGYSNPYYVNVGSTVYNYSQPIPVTYDVAVVAENERDPADEVFSNAVAAFKQNDYDAALDITNKGIAQFPDDAVLHEFRALVLFAKQDYQQSAATIHSVLAVGPGWNWTTLSGLYTSVPVYTAQLRALEEATKVNPDDASSRFLLAYHYISCGYPDAAARQLRQVVRLMPDDRVAVDVLKMIDAPTPTVSSETPPQPHPERSARSATPSVDPATLVGTWQAARPDGTRFRLTLSNDSNFQWSFTQKDQPAQEFDGTYTLEENVLALERKDGGSLIAELTPGEGAKFNFRLLGAPDDDPGLDFNR